MEGALSLGVVEVNMTARFLRRVVVLLSLVVLFQIGHPQNARAADDEVLYWNAVGVRAMQVPPAVGGALQPRILALMHTAIYDAVNGIERRYEPIHVTAEAPRGASQRAAAAYAAYRALQLLFPAQDALHRFDADLATSLAGIGDESAIANSASIARGRDWGEYVAEQIVAWGNTDGVNGSTYPGTPSPGPGVWRPTPRPNPTPPPAELPGLPGQFYSLRVARPFFLVDPHHTPVDYRPAGPRSLLSTEYAADVNSIKSIGSIGSATRTPDQTESARFWAGAAASAWNRLAVNAARVRGTTLSQNARLFALMNMTAHDALIVAWDAKYFFDFWRPIHAIRLADTDGNSATDPDTSWTPLIVNPAYPEYYSGHQSLSRAIATVLIDFFGDNMPVQTTSESLPGVTRSWANFSAAADDAMMARVWGGIHYLFTMTDTRDNTKQIAAYILQKALRPINGRKLDQLSSK